MNNRTLLLGGSSVILVIGALLYFAVTTMGGATQTTEPISTDAPPATATPIVSDNTDMNPKKEFQLTVPLENATVTSPLLLSGEARGSWFFEASFPIELRDWKGTVIATTHAEAKADWMTESMVPWEATLTFAATSTTATSTAFSVGTASDGLP